MRSSFAMILLEATLLSAAPAVGPSACPDTRGQVVVDLVNRHRREAGLAELEVDARLIEAAMTHARDLATDRVEPGHRGSDGSDPAVRALAAGYAFEYVGENVAAGTPQASTVVASWMGSPGHRHNILQEQFRQTGVGYVDVPGSEWRTYWVMVYGRFDSSQGGEEAGQLRCHP